MNCRALYTLSTVSVQCPPAHRSVQAHTHTKVLCSASLLLAAELEWITLSVLLLVSLGERETVTHCEIQTHVSSQTLDSFSVALCGNKGLAMKTPPVKGLAS